MADVTDSIATPISGAPDDKAIGGCGWYMSLGPRPCVAEYYKVVPPVDN